MMKFVRAHATIGTVVMGAATAKRALCASDGGNIGSNARGLTTMAADARILPVPNSRTMWGTLPPLPLLGILRGAPPSQQGGEEVEEEEEALLAPPAGCYNASRCNVAPRSLGAPPTIVC